MRPGVDEDITLNPLKTEVSLVPGTYDLYVASESFLESYVYSTNSDTTVFTGTGVANAVRDYLKVDAADVGKSVTATVTAGGTTYTFTVNVIVDTAA